MNRSADAPSPSRDMFERFVDALATSMTERDAGIVELARRSGLSRFHLDRVIRATAGETPARFRRRVLLERAAFRLRSEAAGVLDVAVEAGYTSNEAFTRAFQRAYGVLPSAWRNAPGQLHLPTPNGIHYQPPGTLRIPTREDHTEMTILTGMIDHHLWVINQMIDRADALDDQQLDAPITLSVAGIDCDPTIRSLLSRLVGQMAMWNASVKAEPYDFAVESNESIPSMRRRLTIAGPEFRTQVVEATSGDGTNDTFVDATCEPARVFTFAGMIAHVLTYAAHRRTLVAGALESAGAADLQEDPLVWFAAGR